jgi:anti-sigma factor RsiW
VSAERILSCDDVAGLVDAFVDAELSAPMLLAVARHAGGCAECEAAVRRIAALSESVERTIGAAAAALDLSAVWPAVARRMDAVDTRRAWVRRLRAVPAWSVGLAAAASAVLWFRPASEPGRFATRAPRPNQAVIERIDTSGHFELRRERKNGTTLIMVSAPGRDAVP